MGLDEGKIEQIVEIVVNRLQQESKESLDLPKINNIPYTASAVTDGVFQEIEECIQAATIAQKKLVALPLAVREKIIEAVRQVGLTQADEYGRMEFEETGLGRSTDNVKKNLAASQVLGMEDLVPEVFSGDKGVTIIERIPVGVIASVNPVTNGSPTILFNAIMMLAGGNTVINNPHPKTRIIACRVIRDINKAVTAAGGPPNCICCLEEPTVPSAQTLMTHPKVKLIAVTGGHGVVAFATQTGKRVIAGGPGNPPVVVDETADLDRAAKSIVQGASFSHCIACASEKEIFVVESVADQLKEHLKKYGAYEINASQGEDLLKKIFNEIKAPGEPGVINMDFIGKSPSFILKSIGLEVGDDVQIVILETDKNHPLVWTEQIMPVLPIVRCLNVDEAIDAALAAEQRNGHTMAIHSNCIQNIKKMTSRAKCAAFVKNSSCGLASVGVAGEGYTSFHIATNGEGQTRPRMFTLIRRCVMANDFRYRYGA
ncbi:MAG: aldehyde dehydrogenase [Desulfobacula sp.]|jgi:propionaldehyde dehydrogenase|uniref:aldehyde dehydrogenase n=1 Tax=Desulfobacula sp. TaxID=2593537 RepID=UPI001E034C3D|nr:aldehyde dehydrogenase [Desulfobacula sp.]MBT3485753.1 aldehyde dehydrogenase [Desulfobacula sp.]MBT3803377.1 aldehyde dehydrogenase [Desulfobacula sp.]MBT4024298.1 aldehyde dehydrogenase [Desulfobacula sp.]MBT4198305.1 aldehyde dehydrogenase [Desulfobacula sp.]